MRRLLFTLIFGLSSSSVFALVPNFDGVWMGQGTLTTPQYYRLHCRTLVYDLRQNMNSLTFRFGNIDCPPFHANQEPMSFSIRGNQLFSQGRLVGSINENLIRIDFVDVHGVRERISVQRNMGGLSYHEEEYDFNGVRFFDLQGTLTRRQN